MFFPTMKQYILSPGTKVSPSILKNVLITTILKIVSIKGTWQQRGGFYGFFPQA
jgi:hypothetical protein